MLKFQPRNNIFEYMKNRRALFVLSYDQQLKFNISEIFKIFLSFQKMQYQ